MEFAFVLVAAIVAAGFFLGALLAKIAAEEMKAGNPYFMVLRNFMVVMVVILFLHSLGFSAWLNTVIALAVFLILSALRNFPDAIISILLGLMLASSAQVHVLMASAMLLYSFAVGSLCGAQKRILTLIAISLAFFISALVGYVLF